MFDIPIVMLHSVNSDHSDHPMSSLSIYPEELEGYIKMFVKNRYKMISMSDFLAFTEIPDYKFVILTFDDGFIDNLINARTILNKYNARATIFVNPNYVPNEGFKNNSQWGYMSFNQIIEAENSGVFDIQSHTMNHDFIFTSDKIIDFYTPEKYDKYYWLAWMLFDDAVKTWDNSAGKYKNLIPTGYPIFEYNRRLAAPRFTPEKQFIEFIIRNYNNTDDTNKLMIELNNSKINKGDYESKSEYITNAKYIIEESKHILEEKLNKKISVICFPGGGYNEDIISITKACGFRCYMNASKFKNGNNFTFFKKMLSGDFVGLNRMSFVHNTKYIISKKFTAYWIAKISLLSYQKNKFFIIIKTLIKKIRNKNV